MKRCGTRNRVRNFGPAGLQIVRYPRRNIAERCCRRRKRWRFLTLEVSSVMTFKQLGGSSGRSQIYAKIIIGRPFGLPDCFSPRYYSVQDRRIKRFVLWFFVQQLADDSLAAGVEFRNPVRFAVENAFCENRIGSGSIAPDLFAFGT